MSWIWSEKKFTEPEELLLIVCSTVSPHRWDDWGPRCRVWSVHSCKISLSCSCSADGGWRDTLHPGPQEQEQDVPWQRKQLQTPSHGVSQWDGDLVGSIPCHWYNRDHYLVPRLSSPDFVSQLWRKIGYPSMWNDATTSLEALIDICVVIQITQC